MNRKVKAQKVRLWVVISSEKSRESREEVGVWFREQQTNKQTNKYPKYPKTKTKVYILFFVDSHLLRILGNVDGLSNNSLVP